MIIMGNYIYQPMKIIVQYYIVLLHTAHTHIPTEHYKQLFQYYYMFIR